MSKKKPAPIPAYTRRTPQGPVLSVSVDAAKLEDRPKRVRGPMRFRCGISPDGKPWMLRDPEGAWVSYVAYEIGVAAARIEQQQNGGKRGK